MASREEIREGLTKQEWIQKYLEDILADAWRKGAHKQGIDVTEEAEHARLHLSKWGVVLKVGEIQEIPHAAASPDAFYAPGIGVTWERDAPVFRLFKEAGYTLSERLIEVKDET